VWGTRKILEELDDQRRAEAAQHAKTQALIDKFAQRAEEERRLNREILRRNEIVMQQLTQQLSEAVEEFKEQSRETREFSRKEAEATEAHTRAIFALIDRLGNGPTPASGTA
jgi:ABC-type oligopeptide transport system ATPase subunit